MHLIIFAHLLIHKYFVLNSIKEFQTFPHIAGNEGQKTKYFLEAISFETTVNFPVDKRTIY